MTALLVFLAGVGYATWARTLYTWLVRRLPRVRPWAGGLTLLLLFVVFLPQLLDSVGDLRQSMRFDPRNLVREYMEHTVEGGGYIIMPDSNRLLNPNWGGYQGANSFTLSSFRQLQEQSIETHRADGTLYAIVHHDEYTDLLESDPDGYLRETRA